MLRLTHPDALPIAYADGDLDPDCLETAGGGEGVSVPLPPPGEGLEDRSDA